MPSSGAIIAGAAFLKISLDSAEFASGLDNVKSRFQKFAAGVNHWAGQMQYIGTMLSVPIKNAVKKFEEFDTRMRHVQAVTHSTGAEFARLTTFARKLGRETSYTTNEVADSMLALGRMGFNTKEITDATSHVMNLARATGSDLALSAKTAANMLRVFGKEASHTEHFADVMVTVVNNSAQTLDDFAQAVSWSGPKFKMFGESFETMSAALGVLANMGIKGSLAGNSIGRGLVQLSDSKVIDYLRNLNIQVVDANGNLKPYLENLREIAAAMKTMNTQQQMEMLKTVFGMRGMLGNTPLAINMDAIDKMLVTIKDIDGAASDAMKNIEGGIMGVLARLKSAIDDFCIEFGQLFYDTFKDFLVSLTEATKSVTKFISEFKGAISVFLKFGAVSFAIAGVAKMFSILRYSIKAILAPLLAVQSVMNNLRVPDQAKSEAVASARLAMKNFQEQDKISAQAVTLHQEKKAEADAAKAYLKQTKTSRDTITALRKDRLNEIENNRKTAIQNANDTANTNKNAIQNRINTTNGEIKTYNEQIREYYRINKKIKRLEYGKEYTKLIQRNNRTQEQMALVERTRQEVDRLQHNMSYHKGVLVQSAKMFPGYETKDFASMDASAIKALSKDEFNRLYKIIDGERSKYYQQMQNLPARIDWLRTTQLGDRWGRRRAMNKAPNTPAEFEQWRVNEIAKAEAQLQAAPGKLQTSIATKDALNAWNSHVSEIQKNKTEINAKLNDPAYITASKAKPLTANQQATIHDVEYQVRSELASAAFINGLKAPSLKAQAEQQLDIDKALLAKEEEARKQNIDNINKQADEGKKQLDTMVETSKDRVRLAAQASTEADKAESAAGKAAERERKKTNSLWEEAKRQTEGVKKEYGQDAFATDQEKLAQSRLSFAQYAEGIRNGTILMSKGQEAARGLVNEIYASGNASVVAAARTSQYASAVWNLSIKDTAMAMAVEGNSKRRAASYYIEATAAKVAAGANLALKGVLEFIASNALMLGIMAITSAFAAMTQALQKNIQKMTEWREAASKIVGEKINAKDKLRSDRDKLINQYDELEDKNLTDDYKQNVIKRIVEEHPELGSYDEETNRYSLNAQNKDEFKQQVKDLYAPQLKEATADMDKAFTQSLKAFGRELVKRRNAEAGIIGSDSIVDKHKKGDKANATLKPIVDIVKNLDPHFGVTSDIEKQEAYEEMISKGRKEYFEMYNNTKKLDSEYQRLVSEGKGDSAEANALHDTVIKNSAKTEEMYNDLVLKEKQLEQIKETGVINFSLEDFKNLDINEQKAIVKNLKDATKNLQLNEDEMKKNSGALQSLNAVITDLENIVEDETKDSDSELQDTKQKQYEDRQKKANDLANQKAFLDAKDLFSNADKDIQRENLNNEYLNLSNVNPFDAVRVLEGKMDSLSSKDFAESGYEIAKKQYEDLITDANAKGYFNGSMPVDEQEEYKQKIEAAKTNVENARKEYLQRDEAYDSAVKRQEEFVREKNKKYEDRAYSKMTDEQKMSYDIGKSSFLNSVIGKILQLLPQANQNIMTQRFSINGDEQQAVADRNKLLEDLFRAQEQLEDTRFRIEDSRENMLNNRQTESVGSFSAKALNRSLSGNNYQQKSYEEAQKIRGFVSSIAGALNLNNRQIAELLQRWGVAY